MKQYRTPSFSQLGQGSRWLVCTLPGLTFLPAHAHVSIFQIETLDPAADAPSSVVFVIASIVVLTVFWLAFRGASGEITAPESEFTLNSFNRFRETPLLPATHHSAHKRL